MIMHFGIMSVSYEDAVGPSVIVSTIKRNRLLEKSVAGFNVGRERADPLLEQIRVTE